MKNRIFNIVVLGMFALTLTNCGAIFQGAQQTIWNGSSPTLDDYSPIAEMSDIIPKGFPLSRTQGGQGWKRLIEIGPATMLF